MPSCPLSSVLMNPLQNERDDFDAIADYVFRVGNVIVGNVGARLILPR